MSDEVQSEATPESPVNTTETPGWHAQLPDDIKGNEYLNQFANPGEAAKDLLAKKAAVDSFDNRIFVPDDTATEDERKAYREKMEIPDEYDLKGKKFGEIALEGEFGDKIQEKLKNGEFTKKQAGEFLELAGGIIEDVQKLGLKTLQDEYKTAEKIFREEWGKDFDDNRAEVKRIMINYGGADFLKELDRNGLGNAPGLIRFVHNMKPFVGNHVSADGANEPGGRREQAVGLRYPTMAGLTD